MMLVLKSSITKSVLSMTAMTFLHTSIAYAAKGVDDKEKQIPKFIFEGDTKESDFSTRFSDFLQDTVKIPSVEAALAAGIPTGGTTGGEVLWRKCSTSRAHA